MVVMEIVKELTQWEVGYRQPNHTYLINKKGQIVAFAKWHTNEIQILKSRKVLDKRYRKFEKSHHAGLDKIAKQFKEENDAPVKLDNVRLFKVKSKEKEYLVQYNLINKSLSCPCIGYGYRRKCKHVDAVSKQLGV
jgi:hypothetical protein